MQGTEHTYRAAGGFAPQPPNLRGPPLPNDVDRWRRVADWAERDSAHAAHVLKAAGDGTAPPPLSPALLRTTESPMVGP
jgi:hypothetical protein